MIKKMKSEEIKKLLHTKWAGQEIIYKDVTGSTNTDARELAIKGAASGTLVVADKQEAGRGSSGRSWETPPGSNIAMSVVLRPITRPERIPMLTLVMGLSVAEGIDKALEESGAKGYHCSIKWPNDVVLGDRKICGILTELHLSPEGKVEDAITGVGINVNMVDFPKEIEKVAGSLLTQTGVRLDRNLVVARVMERFEENFELFEQTSDLSALKASYEERLVNRDKKVILLDPRRAAVVAPSDEVEEKFKNRDGETGIALGINELGALVVKLDNGDKREVNAGEVSVRGLYGYV